MKNFPLFDNKKGQHLYETWTNYLQELNSYFLSLYNFSEWWKIDYRENEKLEPDTASLNLPIIPYHQYIRTKRDHDLVIDDAVVYNSHAGDIILSQARAENGIDNQTSPIKRDFNYYFVQPASWGSYYVPSFQYQNGELYMYWTFDRYAEEKYGLIYNFAWEVYPTRYFCWENINRQSYGWNIPSARKERDQTITIIADKNKRLWFTQEKPLMGQLYIDNEPVYCDTVESFSKVARSNIGSYTINNREYKNEWPDDVRLEVL